MATNEKTRMLKSEHADQDCCCINSCHRDVEVSYKVNPRGEAFLLCSRHWSEFSVIEELKKAWNFLRRMGYDKKMILWWIEQHSRSSAGSRRSLLSKEEEETVMAKKIEKEETESKKGSVGQAWVKIFDSNAKVRRKDRLTDAEIHEAMQNSFPDRKSFEITEVAGVQRTRRHYNKGGWSDGIEPDPQSVPFNDAGEVLKVKRGRTAKKDVNDEKQSKNKKTKKSKKSKRATFDE